MKLLMNEQIKAENMVVIDKLGKSRGVLSRKAAMGLAEYEGADLIAIDLKQNPPVCKIADAGKMLYEMSKKSDKHVKKMLVKEIRIRPITEKHDLEVKTRKINELIEEGHKVRLSMVYSGREITHREVGNPIWQYFKENIVGSFEADPKFEGKIASVMITAAKPSVKPKVMKV